jgi:hypothetical protein
LGALATLVIAPALKAGTGFYMDDWGVLYYEKVNGFWRAAGAGKFGSRPGAWAVETVTYGVLRAHPLPWLILLTVLATGIATCIWLLLARFIRPSAALAVAALWLLVPDHQSLRIFPNVAPITTSLLLLLLGLVLYERERTNLGTLAICMGISCYESAYLPAVAGLLVVALVANRGTRRQLVIALVLATITIAGMSIFPTYPLSSAHLGMPLSILDGQLSTGLTPNHTAGAVLLVLLVLAALVALVRWRRHDPEGTASAQFMVLGLAVIVIGLSSFVIRAPDGVRGINDRAFGVSSIGTALLWFGAISTLARPRIVRTIGVLAFAALIGSTNITYERDWSNVAHETTAALHALDTRYHGHPPSHLVVGPVAYNRGGVRSLHDIYIGGASLIVDGHAFTVVICETQAQWDATPPSQRITWAQLTGSG